MSQQDLVTAKEVLRRFGIPRATLYRLVETGRIPAHESPRQPWHQRRHFLFSLAEVAAALEAMKQ